MATAFDDIELQSLGDYKFFAYIIGQKLRNPNFKPQWLQAFLKTFLQQIKPVCSLKCYEKIEKNLNDLANQKNQEQKQQKAELELKSNRIVKKLITAKVVGKTDKFGVDIGDDYSSSEGSGEDYDEKNEN